MIYIIDIETTGLDPEKCQIIEFACIKVNDQLEEYDRYETLIRHEAYHIEPVAGQMNLELLKKLWSGDGVRDWVGEFANWIEFSSKIVCCGKNFASFDRRFLERVPGFPKMHHRTIDPMIYFWKADDPVPPNLEECCRRAGIEFSNAKHHTAMYDCEVVLELLRRGYDRTK